MQKIVEDYVATTDLAALDDSCMTDAFIMPFFLYLSGPQP
jgi:hypothetical protein